MPKIIFIEGNIGTGKSTMLKKIKEFKTNKKVQVIFEPVDNWQSLKDDNNKNILSYFYEDMRRYAYSFQSFAFFSRISLLEKIDDEADYVFIERSVFSDKYIFAKNCYQEKLMTDIEWQLYCKWFDWFEKRYFSDKKYSIIYLKCSPEICLERIKKRARHEEKNIEVSYLKSIHNRHEEWLKDNNIILDASNIKNIENFIDDTLNDSYQENIKQIIYSAK